MPETTGIWGMLDQLGDAAQKLAEIYEMLVQAGLIKGELPEIPVPYVPEKPWWKSPYLPLGIGIATVGGAGIYYVAKKKK
ncbi:unnamed protein product [marine sediment metagenome]|uniref:Uncharacterized protein n=1 Tax=marine sediment metagenome TaxID=412755 RepID=X1P658_9ZZZZ